MDSESSSYKAWIKEAVLLRDAFFLAVRMIHPKLPKWFLRIAVLEDVGVIATDNFREFGVHSMHPLDILRKKGLKLFVSRLAAPLLRWTNTLRGTVIMYSWLKKHRAAKAMRKGMLEDVAFVHGKAAI